ncbi:DDE-type integrase/transposase/recombinase [Lysinibacillus mangiferihumi]|uniref:DDE-type integrase/transposase/recombinase n=1 Tax=Lysinibacillus mangiferihumi TaxID=1130819 RepID=A0A4U2YZI7_9BACI|nr:DDE-type integrase/transposase/recombinase [Lysinibacillus mangiferihumi]
MHSNQGFQYTSIKYHQTAEQLGMIGSHSRKGNCYDNACIESFFSHFKSEYLYLLQDRSEEEIIRAIVSISTFITTNAFKNDSTF